MFDENFIFFLAAYTEHNYIDNNNNNNYNNNNIVHEFINAKREE